MNRKIDLKPDKRSREPQPIVSMYDPDPPISVCPRLCMHLNGIYIVRQKFDNVTYPVKIQQARTVKACHIDRCCPYSIRSSVEWFYRT